MLINLINNGKNYITAHEMVKITRRFCIKLIHVDILKIPTKE